jgi:hypothetical protein
MKLGYFILILGFMIPLEAGNFDLASKNVPSKPFSRSKKVQLMKYFGLSSTITYGCLYLIAKTSGDPISQTRLLSYAVGIPTVMGLGLYLAVLIKLKPFNSLIT